MAQLQSITQPAHAEHSVEAQMFQQVHQVRGTRAFRPIHIGNMVVVYWGQKFSVEKLRRFFSLTGAEMPAASIARGGELYGVNLFERSEVGGREVLQAIHYVTDPRFSHYAWSQKRLVLGDSFSEAYTADELRQIMFDICLYVRPAVSSASQADQMMQDIASQLEASLSLF